MNYFIILLVLCLSYIMVYHCLSNDEDQEVIDLIFKEMNGNKSDTEYDADDEEGTKSGFISCDVKKSIKEYIEKLKQSGKINIIESSNELVREAKLLVKNNTYSPSIIAYNVASDLNDKHFNDTVVSVVKQSIGTYLTLKDISDHISSQLNEKYNYYYWNCIVGVHSSEQFSHQLWPDINIVIRIGGISITIFSPSQKSAWDLIEDARKIKSASSAKIIDSKIPEGMKNDVIETTIRVINNKSNSDFTDVSRDLVAKICQKYGGNNWQTIIGPKHHQFSYDVKSDLMVQFSINYVEVILFNSTRKSFTDMLKDAKKHLNSVHTLRARMSHFIAKDVIEIIKSGIIKYNDGTSITDFVSESLNKKYGIQWFTVLSFGPHEFGLDANSLKITESIVLAVGEMRFFVYKLFQLTSQEQIIQQARKYEPQIKSNLLNSSEVEDFAINTAKETLETETSLDMISAKIQEKFEHKFSNEWQCIIRLSSYQYYSNLRYQPNSLIEFRIGEIIFRLFKFVPRIEKEKCAPEATEKIREAKETCYKVRCHAHSEGSWCPENMITKSWEYCWGGLGKKEECCHR